MSALIKGASQVVDVQKLTASPNTDKSRFLTLCYGLATMLDADAVLMQPHFLRVFRPKNRLLSPRFLHDLKSKAKHIQNNFQARALFSSSARETFKKARFSWLFCISRTRSGTRSMVCVPFFLRLRRKFFDARQTTRSAMNFGRCLRFESGVVILGRRPRRERRRT